MTKEISVKVSVRPIHRNGANAYEYVVKNDRGGEEFSVGDGAVYVGRNVWPDAANLFGVFNQLFEKKAENANDIERDDATATDPRSAGEWGDGGESPVQPEEPGSGPVARNDQPASIEDDRVLDTVGNQSGPAARGIPADGEFVAETESVAGSGDAPHADDQQAAAVERPVLGSNHGPFIALTGKNNICGDFVFPGADGQDLLRITPETFIFKGEEIQDAGKAYDALTYALNMALGRLCVGGGGGSGGISSGVGGSNAGSLTAGRCGVGGSGNSNSNWRAGGGGVSKLPRGSVNYDTDPYFAYNIRNVVFEARLEEALPRLTSVTEADLENDPNKGKLDYTTGLLPGEVPLGEPKECVLGMGKIRIHRFMDDWMQALATEKEILPLMSEVRRYVEDMAPTRYSVEQMQSMRVVNNVGGKYGTGYVVIMDGHVIAKLSGPVLPPLDGEDA